MRIILHDKSAPRTCPYCRDSLGAAGIVSCARCGTTYHAECAQLAVHCALIGCGGGFGALALALARIGIALRPPRDEPSDERIAALMAIAPAMLAYDARLRLKSPVPIVVAYLDEAAAADACASLERVGLAPVAIESAELARTDAFSVRRVDREGATLVLESHAGRAAKLDLGSARLVVRGRYVDVEPHRDATTRRRGAGVGGLFDHTTNPTAKRRPPTPRYAPFVHAYTASSAPFVFEAGKIESDFRFLGDARTPSTRLNHIALAELLARGEAIVDATLERFEGTLSAHFVHGRELQSNRRYAASVSRLIYHTSGGAA